MVEQAACGWRRREADCSHLGRREDSRTRQRAGIETSRSPLFRLFLLKMLRPLTYVCACWPAEAREDIKFPATGATDVHTDKHTK